MPPCGRLTLVHILTLLLSLFTAPALTQGFRSPPPPALTQGFRSPPPLPSSVMHSSPPRRQTDLHRTMLFLHKLNVYIDSIISKQANTRRPAQPSARQQEKNRSSLKRISGYAGLDNLDMITSNLDQGNNSGRRRYRPRPRPTKYGPYIRMRGGRLQQLFKAGRVAPQRNHVMSFNIFPTS